MLPLPLTAGVAKSMKNRSHLFSPQTLAILFIRLFIRWSKCSPRLLPPLPAYWISHQVNVLLLMLIEKNTIDRPSTSLLPLLHFPCHGIKIANLRNFLSKFMQMSISSPEREQVDTKAIRIQCSLQQFIKHRQIANVYKHRAVNNFQNDELAAGS